MIYIKSGIITVNILLDFAIRKEGIFMLSRLRINIIDL